MLQVKFTLDSADAQIFTVAPGQHLYTDSDPSITAVAPELNGLEGIRISENKANSGSVPLTVTLAQPAQALVGFFQSGSDHHPPAHPASGDWSLQMIDAVTSTQNPAFSVWSRTLPAGRTELNPGTGAYVVLGFVSPETHLSPQISFYPSPQTGQPNLDWLFVE